VLCALPLVPSSTGGAIASITDSSKDDLQSSHARKADRRVLRRVRRQPDHRRRRRRVQGLEPEKRLEAWHETHNVWLQVASEIGIFGFAVFAFLMARAVGGVWQVRRMLARVRAAAARARRRLPAARTGGVPEVSEDEGLLFDAHSAAMAASLAGFFVCSFFSSIRLRLDLLLPARAGGRAARHPARAHSERGARRGGRRGHGREAPGLRAAHAGSRRVIRSLVAGAVDSVRRADRAIGQRSGRRAVLVDARTPVNFTMVAPIYRAMSADSRVKFYFTASEEPHRLRDIYREANGVTLIHPSVARRMRFDAYVASDFMWQPLPRGTCRIQMFHGVGGKYGFDAPTTSMRVWDRVFFVNERRLRNFVKAGAIDADSPAIRLIGYPKVDALVNGTWNRASVLEPLGLDPSRPTVLYAPTWSPASSLNAMGVDLVRRLLESGVNVIMKLHDRSRDVRDFYSGGVDWVETLTPILANGRGALAPGHDISPYLVAADLMVTDHSSAGFEFLLRDRPARAHPLPRADSRGQHPSRLRRSARLGLGIGLDTGGNRPRGRAGSRRA
jgi:hypothetical protein